MNKNLYRIVFNKTRGIMMVVAENVSAQGNRDTTSSASGAIKLAPEPLVLLMRSISLAAKITVGVMTLAMPLSYAQIVADPNAPSNQRPTIVQTANGLPQVNIQAPSAAGVSRNTYSQFDVQRNGAILNNSRDNVQTQTGGWIQGNPWLSGGAARVILNEVNSSNPSQLRGYVEVAGQKAEVIIANPAGIQVNGGGFINADRVTLTTGTAVMNHVNNGSLDSYRISQGVISVDGLGLDIGIALSFNLLLAGCGIGGMWMNGNPFPTPVKPYLEYWEKPGMTADSRMQVSASCGGGLSDRPGHSEEQIKAAQRNGEKRGQTYARLFNDWERCMIKNGYRYTGMCYDNETSRSSPACGAP